MKKLTLVLGLLLALSACSFIKTQVAERKLDWEACKAEPACLEGANTWQSKTELLATPIAMAVPVPGAAAAPKVLGYGAFALAMLLGGHALRKKKTA